RYGFRCCHLKNIWTAPLPPETELSRQMTTSTTSIDIMGLQAAYANLHTDQERDYFMQRYHDVISSFGDIPSTFKRPVSSWKALNLRKTLLMASSVRLKPLNCSRLPCVYAQETLTFLLTQKKTCVKNYVQKE